jgi:predicted nuclease of predicted toxin-antitoxin system
VEVLKKAQPEGRILLTEDKDFGQLVWAGAQEGSGVILLRYPHHARQDISTRVVDFVTQYEDRIAGLFVVIQPDKIRMRKKSGGDTEG